MPVCCAASEIACDSCDSINVRDSPPTCSPASGISSTGKFHATRLLCRTEYGSRRFVFTQFPSASLQTGSFRVDFEFSFRATPEAAQLERKRTNKLDLSRDVNGITEVFSGKLTLLLEVQISHGILQNSAGFPQFVFSKYIGTRAAVVSRDSTWPNISELTLSRYLLSDPSAITRSRQ